MTDRPLSPEGAAQLLRSGGVVIIPTETVYGLAGSIDSASALSRIFEIKQRPFENPLIVHVESPDDLRSVAREVPESAVLLASHFWPGPITLVLNRSSRVNELVSAGGQTVAVRMPDHSIAREIIRLAGTPLAAPSANLFMRLSPTRFNDLDPDVLRGADGAVDGGDCGFGIESTVVDCTVEPVRILRPGALGRSKIEAVVSVGEVKGYEGAPRKSPGGYARHYSPTTPLSLVERLESSDPGISFEEPENQFQVQLPRDPGAYAKLLYSTLRSLDRLELSELKVQRPPKSSDWEAVWDRLVKAATR